MYSNGNSFSGNSSFGASAGNAIGGEEGGRWPFPPWRCFGLRQSDDRGNV